VVVVETWYRELRGDLDVAVAGVGVGRV